MPKAFEEMASKGMGKAKAAKARIKGLKGIFKQLAQEHGEADALLKRISMSSDPEVRAELFPKVRKELLSHERGELDLLYPRLREHDATRAIAEDHEREAVEMESLIDRLSAQAFDDPEWESSFERLVELVEHHAQEEESEYFPLAQDTLGEPAAQELAERYKARKQEFERELQ